MQSKAFHWEKEQEKKLTECNNMGKKSLQLVKSLFTKDMQNHIIPEMKGYMNFKLIRGETARQNIPNTIQT